MMANWLPQSSLELLSVDTFSHGRLSVHASMISCQASPVAHLIDRRGHTNTRASWSKYARHDLCHDNKRQCTHRVVLGCARLQSDYGCRLSEITMLAMIYFKFNGDLRCKIIKCKKYILSKQVKKNCCRSYDITNSTGRTERWREEW